MATSVAERGTAVGLTVLGAFQLGLAAGAPWGEASYGGAHRGTLPDRLRVVSGVAALAYAGGAVLVLRGTGSPRTRARGFTTLSAVMGVATLVNGASRSPAERALWTPTAAAIAALAWRARDPQR